MGEHGALNPPFVGHLAVEVCESLSHVFALLLWQPKQQPRANNKKQSRADASVS